MEKKILVSYFSCSGVTKNVGHRIASLIESDEYEIKPKIPYTAADLNWMDKNSRSTIEMKDASSRPEIADTCTNMDEYDIIFVGFPIWWYVAPTIINTFLESYDFSNKTVIPFCTSGGSGVGKTDSILHQSCNDLVNWKPCKLLKSNMSDQDILNWINSLNI